MSAIRHEHFVTITLSTYAYLYEFLIYPNIPHDISDHTYFKYPKNKYGDIHILSAG